MAANKKGTSTTNPILPDRDVRKFYISAPITDLPLNTVRVASISSNRASSVSSLSSSSSSSPKRQPTIHSPLLRARSSQSSPKMVASRRSWSSASAMRSSPPTLLPGRSGSLPSSPVLSGSSYRPRSPSSPTLSPLCRSVARLHGSTIDNVFTITVSEPLVSLFSWFNSVCHRFFPKE